MPPYHSRDDRVVYVEGTRVVSRKGSGRAVELVALDGPEPVVDLALNSAGSLLAVATQHTLRIYIVDSGLPAQRMRVDGLPLDAGVRRVLWHPCAREDAGLVVLTQHSLVSVYCPPGEPATVETTRLLDPEGIELDAAGASFGSPDAPAGLLTLYVATRDGDIYRLCPFAPPEIELPRARLATAREFASLGSWPVELDSWSERNGAVAVLKRPPAQDLLLRLSDEPLKLVPYPRELYDEDVLDLAVGGLGRGWAADLVVQTTTHFVNFFVPEAPVSSTLVLVAAVRFRRAQAVRRVCAVTPAVVVINTNTETHVLNIEEWLAELAARRRVLQTPAADTRATAPDLPPTQVESVALSYAYTTPHSVETVAVDAAAAGDAGSRRSWPLRRAAGPDAVDKALEKLTISPDSGSFVRPPEAAPWRSVLGMDAAPGRTPTTLLDANLAALYDLDGLAQSYEQKVAALLKALVELQFDRQSQRQELLAQLERAASCMDRKSSIDARAKPLLDAVAAAASRQTRLNERIASVVSAADRIEEKRDAERPLCAAEVRWFDELETQLSTKVDVTQSRFESLKTAVARLQELRGSQEPAAPSARLSHAQLRTIKSRLQQQAQLLGSLKASLEQ